MKKPLEKNDFCDKKISIIMGIYNCAETLDQAVVSLQNQTYSNWELIMCDDGSTDATLEVAKTLAKQDYRIRLLKNSKNRGLNYTLNRCLKYASGDYIARMDGDDESLPERFEKQLDYLENHPEYAIVSCPMILFDDSGDWGRNKVPEYPQTIDLIIGTPICHAPVMMRKECMDRVGGYTIDRKMIRVEDVNLWIKLYANGYRCYNLQVPLYRMRNDKNALNRRKYIYRINSTYVRLQGCKKLHLSGVAYIYALKPMLIGLIPARIRDLVRLKNRCY